MTNLHVDALVLGAAGPIGQAVERRCAAAGLRFHMTSRRSVTHALDVSDRAGLRMAVQNLQPDAVIDLSNAFAAHNDPVGAVSAMEGVLEAAVQGGVKRFVLASSAAVYGDMGHRPYIESDPARGTSPYALWKIRSEQLLGEARAAGGISSIALRIFNVFGPGCDSSLINRLVGGPVPRLASGSRFVRDYVHVDEVAEAIIAATFTTSVDGAVNIATGIPVDNLQLATAARSGAYLTGDPLSSYSVGDPRAAYESLGWRARTTALDHLADKTDV